MYIQVICYIFLHCLDFHEILKTGVPEVYTEIPGNSKPTKGAAIDQPQIIIS